VAIGDQGNVFTRLKSYLPPWFGSGLTPVLDALLQAPAWALSFVYQLYAYATLQTRIKSQTDGWLDLTSADFFGAALPRKANETDAAFDARILANLFVEKATRDGIEDALERLTGQTPIIFEPLRPLDTGAYGAPNWGYAEAGGYGSLLMPYQCLVDAYRPVNQSGTPALAGYGSPNGGYGDASWLVWGDQTRLGGIVTDADIYAIVDATKPIGAIIWVQIHTAAAPGGQLDFSDPDDSGFVAAI
jgi:hypothetical protein